MSSKTLQREAPEGELSVGFETRFRVNLLVLGMMAVVFGTEANECPVQHWGNEITTRSCRVGNDRYRFSRSKRVNEGKTEYGILVYKDINQYIGGTSHTEFWVPFTALSEVEVAFSRVEIDGVPS